MINRILDKYIESNYKTIADLPADAAIQCSEKKIIENTKIMIIDDEELELEKTLRAIGYPVVRKDDIDLLSDVEDYPIIICDYKGVGQKFKNDFEGIYLLSLIKDKYPEKICYLLSVAATFNCKISEYAKKFNEMILKGEESKLIDYIRQDSAKFFNPKDVWLHYKTLLRGKGISDKQICQLENLYVLSFLKKKDFLTKNRIYINIESNLNINFNIKVGLINL